MTKEDIFTEECTAIFQEKKQRESLDPGYSSFKKFFDSMHAFFIFLGFAALIATFFTEVTVVQATCFLIIAHVISVRQMATNELLAEIAIDTAHTRAYIATVIRSSQENQK